MLGEGEGQPIRHITWGVGALEASRDMETGQVSPRAVAVPGPMVEQGARAAMVDPGTQAVMADPGTLWAMVGNPPPPKLFFARGGALESRTLGGDLEARTVGGALEARTLGSALEWTL